MEAEPAAGDGLDGDIDCDPAVVVIMTLLYLATVFRKGWASVGAAMPPVNRRRKGIMRP